MVVVYVSHQRQVRSPGSPRMVVSRTHKQQQVAREEVEGREREDRLQVGIVALLVGRSTLNQKSLSGSR